MTCIDNWAAALKISVTLSALAFGVSLAGEEPLDYSPRPDERQLPHAMHSAMTELPRITAGKENADLIGGDNRVLQAAVDYIAGLGGGLVEIGSGDYVMRDSLHLRSHVSVRGRAGQTRLHKADSAVSPLALDGDFGEQQITVADPTGFEVGCGVTISDDRSGGFHTTVARITGRRGNTFSIDKPLMSDYMVQNKARAATVFPVVSGCDIEGAGIESLVVLGHQETNVPLNGCRGAGIYLYRGHGTAIKNCEVRGYNGDGISFQQSNDVTVEGCVSMDNADLGLHPGSGSQRPVVRKCTARNNGTDGLFLCWRVRHGLFEDNLLEQNGRYGISIGHKDSDNLLQRNRVLQNAHEGVYFRNESLGMAAHRNRLVENLIENNGTVVASPGIRIRGETNGLVFEKNTIRDTRDRGSRTQTVGILVEPQAGQLTLRDNTIEADIPIEDQRPDAVRPQPK
jgi:polygalacturonase